MTHFETAESLPAPDRGDIAAVLARKADEDATAVREFAGNSRVADSSSSGEVVAGRLNTNAYAIALPPGRKATRSSC